MAVLSLVYAVMDDSTAMSQPGLRAEGFTDFYRACRRLADSWRVSDPFTPSDPDAPVAVLTSSFTASAAESVVVAFKGHAQTAFFGEPTGAFTTGVVQLRLPDGAVLNVSAGYPVDRDGHRYEQAIQPDEQFLYLPDHPEDAALERATEWLMDQQACL